MRLGVGRTLRRLSVMIGELGDGRVLLTGPAEEWCLIAGGRKSVELLPDRRPGDGADPRRGGSWWQAIYMDRISDRFDARD